jgi:hypothetical protein
MHEGKGIFFSVVYFVFFLCFLLRNYFSSLTAKHQLVVTVDSLSKDTSCLLDLFLLNGYMYLGQYK